MQPFVLISILAFGLILVIALIVLAIMLRRSSSEGLDIQETHPQGYYVSIGISTGAGLGVAFGLALDNLALGIAIGIAIGTSIGAALEQKNKDKVRPLSGSEQLTQRRGLILALVLGLVILLVIVGLILFAAK